MPYACLKCSDVDSNVLAIPSRIAMLGTTMINFDQPYCLFNSSIVLIYVYVLPVPVSISTVKVKQSFELSIFVFLSLPPMDILTSLLSVSMPFFFCVA